MMSQAARYFIPDPSRWPILGSIALLCMASGAALWMNEATWGKFVLITGVLILFFMLFGWFGSVARESEGGKYNKQVDSGFRWGMSWFIFSEVMFFAAFFGALFYMRVLSVPWLGDLDHKLLWPDFTAQWPSAGPGFAEKFTPMAAWGVPAINTLILLSSGATVTWAHWGLLKNNRSQLIIGLAMTVALGMTFLYLQATEYHEAYTDAQSEAHHRRVRRDILHADRFSRVSCDGRHVDADHDSGAQHRRALQCGASFRIRRRGVVLALRRRRMAAVVYTCLLVIKGHEHRCKEEVPLGKSAPHECAAFFFNARIAAQ